MKQFCTSIPEKVLTHFTNQQSSGLSIADYCKEHKIRPSTFYGWNKRYKKQSSPGNASDTSASFIEIPVRPSSRPSSRIRITRTEIEFPAEKAELIYEALKTLLPVD